MMDDFTCNLEKVLSIKEWLQTPETDDSCPPCMIAPLASYYLGALQDARETRLANRLQEIYEGGDALTIAEELDRIKSAVGESLKSELKTLDCMAQSFKKSTMQF